MSKDDATVHIGATDIGVRRHFHPEYNVVHGVDTSRVLPMEERKYRMGGKVLEHRMKKMEEQTNPMKIDLKRIRSDSMGSEGDTGSPIASSPPVFPQVPNIQSSSLPSSSGLLSSAFQVRPMSGDKIMKHEFDFVNK